MAWWQVILILVIVLLVLAIKYLPWWALLILIAIPILGWRYIGGAVLYVMFRRTARSLGKVLRGATVTVHTIEAVPPPDAKVLEEAFADEEEDDEDFASEALDEPPEARDWYLIEVSIEPKPFPAAHEEDDPGGWQPEALALVPEDAGPGEIDMGCRVGRIERQVEGGYRIAGNWCSYGDERLRLLIGVTPGLKKLKFCYFFEEFGGHIELPPPHARPALTEPS